MSAAAVGILAGLILGLAGAFGGFGAFVVTLFLGLVGFVAGRLWEGNRDLSSIFGGGQRDDRGTAFEDRDRW